ncbi:hypothetical protein L596_030858 [Steinernema carpocapsae]|uniref:Uncharacterized protein n=1 Tax=Steinernema carpocapsae TaxID=34508 RepID=A0A4U5LND3_STECR|nr:hypothetical protein L596_030858 [Steinernema carpocapsae]
MTVNLHDPRDPWAWRNPWTSESRANYAELWIIVPIIICLSLIAVIVVVPVVVHRYFKECCPCPKIWLCIDRFLSTCSDFDEPSNESNMESQHECSAAWNSGDYYRNQYTLKPPPMNYYLYQHKRSNSVSHHLTQSHSAPDNVREADMLRQWNQSMSSVNSVKSEKAHFIVPKIKLERV